MIAQEPCMNKLGLKRLYRHKKRFHKNIIDTKINCKGFFFTLKRYGSLNK